MQCANSSRSVFPGAVEQLELKRGRVLERAASVNHFDAAPLGQLLQPAAERVDHFFLAGAEHVDIDFRRAEGDAPLVHLFRFAQHACDMQQRFGRNAAAQQAGSAQPRIGFDERNFHSQVGGQERGGVPPRPPSKNHKWRIHETLTKGNELIRAMRRIVFKTGEHVAANKPLSLCDAHRGVKACHISAHWRSNDRGFDAYARRYRTVRFVEESERDNWLSSLEALSDESNLFARFFKVRPGLGGR